MYNSVLAIAPEEATTRQAPMLVQNWETLKRFKWIAVGVIGSALLIGIMITLLMSPQYTATTRVEISREQKNVTNVRGVDQIDARDNLEFYQTQYSLLEARTLAERVARELRLASRDDFFAAHGVDPEGSDVFSESGGGQADRRAREKLAVDLLLDHVAIAPIERSSLVDVSYSSGSPDLSAAIVNSWVRQFVQSSIDRRYNSTADARAFLEQRLAELRRRVEDSERQAVTFAERNNIVAIDQSPSRAGGGSRTLAAANLEGLSDALVKATAERIEAGSRAKVRGTSIEALNNPAINDLREKRAELVSQRAKLLTQFEPTYPAVQALSEEIAALDTQIHGEENRAASVRSGTYQEAIARENRLRSAVSQAKAQLAEQQRDSIQYNIFQREADTNRQLYDALLQRYKEIGVAGVNASNIAVIDAAQVPTKPSSPKLLLNLVLALGAGIFLAAVTIFVLDQIDERLRDPSRVADALGIPFVGSVVAVDGEPAEAFADVKSDLFESYLTVRSSLALASDHGFPRSLMLTSTRSGEGKTTSALGLSAVLGRVGKSVALIDADMRSPSIHEILALTNERGLSNYLAGDDHWREIIQPTRFKGVSTIAAGPHPPSAAELLSGDRLSQLLAHLLGEFDHVVIDAPPMLGLSDAPMIARVVDGCLFVVEANGVPVRGIRSAVTRLQTTNASIVGALLTKLDARQASYGYGYEYGDRYGAQIPEA
jgi:capsular exopolysaccharide synthesis family protein